jgi:hypothetical protein
VNNEEIPTHSLIDCTATGIALMDQDLAHYHQIPFQELKEETELELSNGRPIESGDITHISVKLIGSMDITMPRTMM